jgi:hypothetical protein
MMAQLGAQLRDLRVQVAQVQRDYGKGAADIRAQIADLERRVAMSEAARAVAAATAPLEVPGDVAPAPASSSAPAQRMAPAPPVMLASATAPARAPGPALRTRYHVQAASPGMAFLAEVDRSGDEGAQLEVAVGDTIPGYGAVRSIGQRGTAWVVATEHGDIQ